MKNTFYTVTVYYHIENAKGTKHAWTSWHTLETVCEGYSGIRSFLNCFVYKWQERHYNENSYPYKVTVTETIIWR